MAYIGDLYNAILDITRKDKRGLAFSVGAYNNICNVSDNELFTQQIQKFQLTNIVTESMLPFLKSGSITSTSWALPADFSHIIGQPIYNSTPVDIVTENEYSFRIWDELTKPSTTYPICKFESGSKLVCYPATVTPITIKYFKAPATVKLDYYVYDGRRYLLDVGETHIVVTGETYPLETTQPGVGSSYTSKTVDFEWETVPEKAELVNLVLKKLGIALTDVNIEQIAQQDKINII